MEKHSQFTRRIVIRKDITTVFNAWARQGGMEEWFLKSAVFSRNDNDLEKGELITEGDFYRWIWHTWPENVQEGVVTKCIQNESFNFTFEPAGHVDVLFTKLGDEETEIELTQSDIMTDGLSWYNYFHGCCLGWSFWLVNLKAFLEHGIVLDQREIMYSDERHMHIVNQ